MATGQLGQNGGTRKLLRLNSSDKAGNCNHRGQLAGARGRTEERGMNMSNRSKSLDMRGEVDSLLDKACEGLSDPTRLRSSPGPSSRIREPVGGSIGSSSGQTISERIEKLFGSSRPDKTASKEEAVRDSTRTKRFSAPVGDWPLPEWDFVANGKRLTTDSTSPSTPHLSSPLGGQWGAETGRTFPKRLPKGEMNNLPPHAPLFEPKTTRPLQRDPKSLTETSDGGLSVLPVSWGTGDRPSGEQKQGQVQGRHTEEGKRAMISSTLPLDRATSRFMVATDMRASDSHASALSHKASNAPLVKENAHTQHSQSLTHGDWKSDRWDRCRTLSEDVFEANATRITPSPGDDKTTSPGRAAVPSAAGVRNRIHQFEALTRTAHVQPANYRRAFSAVEETAEARAWRGGTERAAGGARGGGQGGIARGDRGRGEEVQKSEFDRALGEVRGAVHEEGNGRKSATGWAMRSSSVDLAGMKLGSRESEAVGDRSVGFGTLCNHKGKLDLPLNGRTNKDSRRDVFIDVPDGHRSTVTSQKREGRVTNAAVNMDTPPYKLSDCKNSEGVAGQSKKTHCRDSPNLSSPVSDDDKTPTNTPHNSIFYPQNKHSTSSFKVTTSLPIKQDVESSAVVRPVSTHTAQSRVTSDPQVSQSVLGRDFLSLPLTSSSSKPSPSSLPFIRPVVRWISDEDEGSDDDDDDDTDDEGTEKDEDSSYDSDSAESSVTVTSAMSQSDRKSFSLSLAELCNFGGVDYDSQSSSDSEECLSGRSVSLSSDTSAFSCVSILDSEELDCLLEDVRALGDTSLQNYEEVQVVVLHKDIGVGLGFTMAGGVDQNKPVTVHKVFPEGVAAKEGSIQEGDRVLSINGTALSGSAHSEVLRTLKRARTRGMAVVVLRRGGFTDPRKGTTGSGSQGPTQTETANIGQRMCVWLEKRSSDLGFCLEGGVGSPLGDRPITVKKVFLGGPLNEVSAGDEVLEVQGISLVGLRRLEAWNLIRKLPPGPVEVVLRHKHQGEGSSREVGQAGLKPNGVQLESQC